ASGASVARAPSSLILVVLRTVLVVIGIAPWWVPVARGFLPLGAAGSALDLLFVPFCHRLASRTLVIGGVAMPVCSRCAGIFAGVALGAAIALPRASSKVWRIIIAVSALAMIADVLAQDVGLHPVWHPSRLATGAAFGYALAASLVTSIG